MPQSKTDQFLKAPLSLQHVIIAITLLTILLAAAPLYLLEPDANDGFAMFAATFFLPAFACAILITIAMPQLEKSRLRVTAVLIWFGVVLPIGIIGLSLPSVLQNPDYFEI